MKDSRSIEIRKRIEMFSFLIVLQPAIELVTEPDYINQKIIQYLEAQKEVDAMHVRTHEYAKTFEDYIRLINSCNNVDTLKRLR